MCGMSDWSHNRDAVPGRPVHPRGLMFRSVLTSGSRWTRTKRVSSQRVVKVVVGSSERQGHLPATYTF